MTEQDLPLGNLLSKVLSCIFKLKFQNHLTNNESFEAENNESVVNTESVYNFLRYLSKWQTLTLVKDDQEKKLTLTIESGKMQSISSYKEDHKR